MHKALDWANQIPFYQAGLQGYSDAAMRIVARRLGAPYCMTEALLDETLLRGGKSLDEARLLDEDHPIAGQLMGSEPEPMRRAARVLLELGYDVIDVNLACPVKKMRRGCRGGHLLADPEAAEAILTAVRDEVGDDAPVTVKLRRGTNESPNASSNFFRIFEKVIDLKFSSATVHGRTVEQKYIGPSRWQFLRDLTRTYKDFTIFGSGDVFEAEDIFSMLKETGVQGVSVARGAIGNPWIFQQAHQILQGGSANPPTLREQRRVLQDHYDLAVEISPRMAERRMRKIGIMFSRQHLQADAVKQAFIGVKNLRDWRAVLEQFYSESASSREEEETAKRA